MVAEKLRYDSWECTDVAGVSRAQMTHVEVFVNGTTKTDSQCAMYQMVDSMTMNSVFHPCDEKPSAQDAQWKYTNVRAPNATLVPVAETQLCVGSTDVRLDTSGTPPRGGLLTQPPLPGTEKTMSDIGPVATLAEANAASGNDFPDLSGTGITRSVASGLWSASSKLPAESFQQLGIQLETTAVQMSIRAINETIQTALAFVYDYGWESVGDPTDDVIRGTVVMGSINPAWRNTTWQWDSLSVLIDAPDPYTARSTVGSDTDFASESVETSRGY